MGPGVCQRRWRPGLPLESPPGLCPAGLLRIPGPGPAPPPERPRPPRRGLFTYGALEACPPAPTPSLRGRDRAAFAKLPPAAEGSVSRVGSVLARAPGAGSPPRTSPASPIEHGSLVATLLIAKTWLGVGGVYLRVPK